MTVNESPDHDGPRTVSVGDLDLSSNFDNPEFHKFLAALKQPFNPDEAFDWDSSLTPGMIPWGWQDDTLTRAARSVRSYALPDALAIKLLTGVATCFANKPGREPWEPAKDAEKKWRDVCRKHPPGRDPQFRPATIPQEVWDHAIKLAEERGQDFDPNHRAKVEDRKAHLRVIEDAQREYEHEKSKALAKRRKRTAAELVKEGPPIPVIDKVLAVGPNGLAGPSEAGKSLWARDLTMHVATGMPWRGHSVPDARNVLWMASEGLHDFKQRFEAHPLWRAAYPLIHVPDGLVNLTSPNDVDDLLSEYKEERPGLVVFDLIYDMGMSDDTGTKDVIPVFASMIRISEAWGCAVLFIGHPGHSTGRRFRGSSMWRQKAQVEWHMADGQLTCEKSKLTEKSTMTVSYEVDYPEIRWLSNGETIHRESERRALVCRDLAQHPDDSERERARRLSEVMEVSVSRARAIVRAYRDGCESDD